MHKAILFLCSLLFSACSVVAAATGSHAPDFSKLTPGTPESTVETELGSPLRTETSAGQTEKVYSYKLGDEPAAGRALGYLVLDIFTLCLAEYILFPLEISNSGNAYEAVVTYDDNNRVKTVVEKQSPKTS